MVTKVGTHEPRRHITTERGLKVLLCYRNGIRRAIRTDHSSYPTTQRALNQLQPGSTKRIPHRFVMHVTGQSRHRSSQRGMRCGRNVLHSIRKPWVRTKFRRQLHKSVAGILVNINLPRRVTGIVNQCGTKLKNTIRHLAHQSALMSARRKIQPIPDRPIGEGLKK